MSTISTGLTPCRQSEVDVVSTVSDGKRTVRDSLVVTIGGQLERVLGTLTALALRWGLDPASLGVYTGLRLFLDNTNRSSLGVGLGAVQEIPILRAEGREAEAQRVADVAYTANTLTCLAYVASLLGLAWLRAPLLDGDPLARKWTWGLAAVAVLAFLKRYESFLIAVLRAHREFVLTTELDILESLVSAVAVTVGLFLAGFWGLLAAVGVLLSVKIAYLHARHPFRFRWDWNYRATIRLMRVGLPILANTAIFGAVLNLDRVLILQVVPDGARAAGLYATAIMGTSWSLDLAGRIVLVLYTSFQTTLGKTRDLKQVALQAARAAEIQAPLLAAGGAVAYVVGPTFLGTLMPPRYAEGLPALRPLLFGTVMLGLAWPARQALITVDRPGRLFAVTLLGLAVTAEAGIIGAERAGIVGVAWAMTFGYSIVSILTSAAALIPELGARGWLGHQRRLVVELAWYLAAAVFAAYVPMPAFGPIVNVILRTVILAAWGVPSLWLWGRKHDWGGLRVRRDATH